jgi:hypothetical protein
MRYPTVWVEDVVRLHMYPPGIKAKTHGDFMAIVVNDIINKKELPAFSKVTLTDHFKFTKKYRPLSPEELKVL